MNATAAISLGRRRIANGGWEWYLVIGSTPVYPNDAGVGIFTDPGVTHAEAFERVMKQWAAK